MSDARINLREMGVTTQALPFALSGVRPSGASVTDFVRVSPERLEMTVNTSENALLTLALAQYPGWRATVDGVDVPLIDTYAGLIGVPITAGEGLRVVVEFVPTTVYVGGVVSVVALVVMVTLWGIRFIVKQA
jgi:uncharacterized membrane protein YfhO